LLGFGALAEFVEDRGGRPDSPPAMTQSNPLLGRLADCCHE
jgi:hypothetical protein